MLQQIETAKADYKSATGATATNLYVGRSEWTTIAQKAEEYTGTSLEVCPCEGDNRLECCGLRVFVVNASSHFAVGSDANIF